MLSYSFVIQLRIYVHSTEPMSPCVVSEFRLTRSDRLKEVNFRFVALRSESQQRTLPSRVCLLCALVFFPIFPFSVSFLFAFVSDPIAVLLSGYFIRFTFRLIGRYNLSSLDCRGLMSIYSRME